MQVRMNLKLSFDDKEFEKSWKFVAPEDKINFKVLYSEIKWAINYRLRHIIAEHKLFVSREQDK